MGFFPESPVANIAPKVFSVNSLVMEENLFLIHIKDIWALTAPPMVARHVLLEVFTRAKCPFANLASLHI